jgi:drug/metabolite transporter (DMT)-like permease
VDVELTPSVETSVAERSRARRLSRSLLAGPAWAALSVAIFSGWFVVTRFSVTRELAIWDIMVLRFGIGAVLLAPILFWPGRRLPLAAWREGFVFALLWGMPFVLLVALGLKLTSAAQAASVAPTAMPIFAGLLGWLFLRERQGRARWLGYAAIVVGLAFLIAAGAAAHGAPNPWGIAALVLAAAMWAVYTLLFRRSGLTSIQSAALICIWSALLFLPAYWLFGLSRLGMASAGEIAFQALYQGVFMSAVAIITFNRAVSLLGPSAATAIIALVPAVATMLAIPVLGEWPVPAEAVAIAIIVAGVLLAAKPVRPAEAVSISSNRKEKS